MRVWLPTIVCFFPVLLSGVEAHEVSQAVLDQEGLLVHAVTSEYQVGPTGIQVLLPDRLEPGRRYPVVYVLPVEAGRGTRWGDSLLEIKNHDLHNEHQSIFVFPSFSDLPWYADHPTIPSIRQETYFLKVVVPTVEANYPTSGERHLLGFSKSGWGAWTLLVRHPNMFQRAAAWDAPLMMEQVGKYGSGGIFGTQENFERYRILDLLRENAMHLRGETRLILTGYDNFRNDHQQIHKLLNELQIPHHYSDGPRRTHAWNSGWVSEAVGILLQKDG